MKWTDFEKDEIHYVKRWVPYLRVGFGLMRYSKVGRETGYATRKEAIEGLIKEIEGCWSRSLKPHLEHTKSIVL